MQVLTSYHVTKLNTSRTSPFLNAKVNLKIHDFRMSIVIIGCIFKDISLITNKYDKKLLNFVVK